MQTLYIHVHVATCTQDGGNLDDVHVLRSSAKPYEQTGHMIYMYYYTVQTELIIVLFCTNDPLLKE